MKIFVSLALAVGLCFGAANAFAQSGTKDHDHKTGSVSKHSEPSEVQMIALNAPGQAAFAEIDRIVRKLSADPMTDWSKVSIPALRAHLIDMHLVTLYADVQQSAMDGGAEFLVTSQDAKVASAIQAMASGHGHMMNQETGLAWETQMVAKGAIVRVTSLDFADIDRIRGLGFIGLLTVGGHHAFHHEMIAAGGMPH